MPLHITTCTQEELKQLNTIASRVGIPSKKIIQYMNAFGCDNTRYQLIWGWLQDPCVPVKFKGFKTLLRNVKVRRLEDWVDATGTPVFKDVKPFIEDFVEMG